MRKQHVIRTVEYLSIIGIVISVFLFLIKLVGEMTNYNPAQSLSMFGLFVVIVLTYSVPIILLSIVLFFITKYNDRNELKSASFRINAFLSGNRLVTGLIAVLGLIIFGLMFVVSIQESFLYFPGHSDYYETALEGIDDYDKLNIESGDMTFSGWAKIDSNIEKTIIYYGGNGENTSTTFYYHHNNNWDGFTNYNFVMVDYPGFGLSSGEITEENIYQMSLVVFDYVANHEDVDPDNIIVLGFSLGTGVASYVSANRDFSKLILVSPYTSMLDMVNTRLPIFHGPLKGLIHHQYDTVSRIAEMNEETLVIASNDDEMISVDVSKELVELLDPDNVLYIDGKSHNYVLASVEAKLKIRDFIDN